ncbi:putative gamma-tubulin complex subunit [Leptomonas pyrrhocoris]|uniref:Spindle pole body component n=1 Tax=Leptomonas pyrrhocoris TaxID=157538 RepID=A0A0N0DW90_LEPPY|nr:putative gamma-tubulin complex subunit [Leptomonas pyrrhocoris]XP_015659928.1 putative gamma-tubulin complex subunit [Leptomonas pyrrhocoris]KPA81488.1 putative gamma-tubulin complex subunit [Leptomonas pyrrhocoris]KPA81489.1 putative gamma-tubulin complex subunit [Leptomonas pyrrhocoris]|eukprot:XP_015659927.1 putative gamma-tubulin complex subunit [Leptomonas pyrrhocoris]
MSSTTEWTRFLTSLEKRGIRFDQVQLATNRQEVIRAAGITDALSIAVIETEWQRNVLNHCAGDGNGFAASATNPSGIRTVRKSSSSLNANSLAPLSSQIVTPAAASLSGLPALDEPSQLSKLPEELQDTVIAAEVLTSAVGLGGLFMQYTPDAASAGGGFSVSSLVPPSMRHLCETVLPVADAFVALRCIEKAEYESRSLVLMALGEVVSEINTSYAHQISKLQLWSEGRPMPLMGVVSEVLRVGHHIVRLRQVLPMDLIQTALADAAAPTASSSASSGLVGPRILNHLCDQVNKFSGSREDHELLMLLLRRTLVPYLRMLHRWMHTGVLDDPYEEFFISEVYRPARPAPTAANHLQQRHVGQFFLDALVPSMTSCGGGYGGLSDGVGSGNGGGNSGSSVAAGTQGRYGTSRRTAAQQDVAAFDRRFSLNKSLIPVFLNSPSKMAKMIFFAGKYCCLLREYGAPLPAFGGAAGEGAGSADGSSLLTWSGADQLQRQVQESFEVASGAVIQLLFAPSIDLLGHLRSLKLYFLQERGDWVVDFLDSADSLLVEYPDRVKAHSMQVLLQAAIARSCASDPYHDLIGCTFAGCTLEELLQEQHRQRDSGRETVRIEEGGIGLLPTRRSTGGGNNNDGVGGEVDAHRSLELLQLEADLQWPLTLVLDAKVLQRLNVIFRLLIWVKTCERRLCELWYTNEILGEFSAAYGLKHQFVQFLRQFQFYAAHFVLEPLWSRLIARIGQTDSVFAISQALTEFFDGVETGLVLSSTQRFRSLAHILELTERFCEVGMHSSTATMPLIEATLHSVEDQFLRALSELASPVGPDYPQLVPLLTWIDFSRFYDQNNVYHVQHSSSSNCGASTRNE